MLKKLLLPVIIVISITVAFGYQDAAAMTVIFDSGPPTDTGTVVFSGISGFIADDFIPTMSASVTDFHFFSFEGQFSVGDTFAYEIRNDAGGGQIGNTILGQGTAIVVEIDEFAVLCSDCVEVWTDFDNPVDVIQGVTYWLVIEAKDGVVFLLDSTLVGNQFLISFDGIIFSGLSVADFPFQITALIQQIGGEIIPIDSASLLLANTQTFSWMIPVVLSVLGIGLFVVSRKSD